MSYEWKGELSDCTMLEEDGYGAHVEKYANDYYFCSVWRIEEGEARRIFHSQGNECWPENGTTACDLAERLIDADKCRRSL